MPYSIVVLIKQVPDMNAVRLDRASGKPVLSGQLAISSYDDYAIEEALALKEKHGGEVVAISAGPATTKDAVTRALAMGADRGIVVQLDNVNQLDTLQVAEILAEHVRGIGPNFVLAGQVSDDNATGQVGPQVAELLGIPSLGSIARIEADGDSLTILRDTEDGRQTISVNTPVMLMTQAGLNEPRYPSLKGIMAAKKKQLDIVPAGASESAGRVTWGEPSVPKRDSAGVLLQDQPPAEAARRLVAWLREMKLA
jgi:electron transfer flavoprotein beta subunit